MKKILSLTLAVLMLAVTLSVSASAIPPMSRILTTTTEGGSVNLAPVTKTALGTTVELIPAADEGWVLAWIIVDGEKLEAADSYRICADDAVNRVEVVFAEIVEPQVSETPEIVLETIYDELTGIFEAIYETVITVLTEAAE